jgi:hypothetical protein
MATIVKEVLVFERATKNSVLYKSEKPYGTTSVPNIYISKFAFEKQGGDWPREITITVEVN